MPLSNNQELWAAVKRLKVAMGVQNELAVIFVNGGLCKATADYEKDGESRMRKWEHRNRDMAKTVLSFCHGSKKRVKVAAAASFGGVVLPTEYLETVRRSVVEHLDRGAEVLLCGLSYGGIIVSSIAESLNNHPRVAFLHVRAISPLRIANAPNVDVQNYVGIKDPLCIKFLGIRPPASVVRRLEYVEEGGYRPFVHDPATNITWTPDYLFRAGVPKYEKHAFTYLFTYFGRQRHLEGRLHGLNVHKDVEGKYVVRVFKDAEEYKAAKLLQLGRMSPEGTRDLLTSVVKKHWQFDPKTIVDGLLDDDAFMAKYEACAMNFASMGDYEHILLTSGALDPDDDGAPKADAKLEALRMDVAALLLKLVPDMRAGNVGIAEVGHAVMRDVDARLPQMVDAVIYDPDFVDMANGVSMTELEQMVADRIPLAMAARADQGFAMSDEDDFEWDEEIRKLVSAPSGWQRQASLPAPR